MDPERLSDLDVPTAQLVQHGLIKTGHYEGTTRGRPGPKTKAAYARFLAEREEAVSGPGVRLALAETIPGRLVEILRGEIGVREVPKDSNRGPSVERYQAATWLSGSGWPWCAAFICWGIAEVEKEKGGLPFDRPETAGAWDFEKWARGGYGDVRGVRLFKPRTTVLAGDIVVFSFSHIGLAIADESGGMVRTVEGNTDASGGREGGGVYEKSRAVGLVRSHIRLPEG